MQILTAPIKSIRCYFKHLGNIITFKGIECEKAVISLQQILKLLLQNVLRYLTQFQITDYKLKLMTAFEYTETT